MFDSTFEDLLAVVRRLRAENGCPWDRAQTPRSLLPYLIEEAYEVREAVLADDDRELAGELGDLALHVAFQVALAEERGVFGGRDVFARILDKMVRRHPHVFGPSGAENVPGIQPPQLDVRPPAWEQMKRSERAARDGAARLLDGIPLALPALLKAQRIQERVAEVEFDWPDVTGALDKLREEVEETASQLAGDAADADALAEELGDLLFAAVNVARKAGVVAEDALELANAKFRRRFDAVEALARERGIDLASAGLETLDGLWEDVKAGETHEA